MKDCQINFWKQILRNEISFHLALRYLSFLQCGHNTKYFILHVFIVFCTLPQKVPLGLNHIYLTRLRQNQLHGNPNMKNDLFLYHKHPFKMFPYSLECLVRYLINIDEYGICTSYNTQFHFAMLMVRTNTYNVKLCNQYRHVYYHLLANINNKSD